MATTTTNNNSDKHKKEPVSAAGSTVIIEPMSINNNTTFVQADPSTFRAVVQKLTGVTENPVVEKLPVTNGNNHNNLPSPRSSSAAAAATGAGQSNGSRNTSFKLHERRQYHNSSMRKLETTSSFVHQHHQGLINYHQHQHQFRSSSLSPSCCFNGDHQKVLISPVSTLDHYHFLIPSPRTPRSPQEEEEKAISEKGFYFHPSPRSKTNNNHDHDHLHHHNPPQLLPLFPLTSPRDSSSSSS